MKAVFEVKTIEAEWKPPFGKNVKTDVFTVSVGEEFDRIHGNGNNESVFKLLNVQGENAKIRYSNLFTLKENNGNAGKGKTLTMPKGHEEAMSYLWGERGITKKVVFRGFSSGESQNQGNGTEQVQETGVYAPKKEMPMKEPSPGEQEQKEQANPITSLFE